MSENNLTRQNKTLHLFFKIKINKKNWPEKQLNYIWPYLKRAVIGPEIAQI